MNCPLCAEPMKAEGEWPYTHQRAAKPWFTFQCNRWTCEPCGVYVHQETKEVA